MYYIAYIDANGKENGLLCNNLAEMHSITFSPEVQVVTTIDFKVKGKTYQDRKAYLYDIATDFSTHFYPGLFASDCWWIGDWFHIQGKRYGLLEEFIENGLCS